MGNRILFRGKRLDTGEWVEGGYYQEPYTDNVYITFWNSFGLGFMDACQVVRDTVGQYTGLTDKNGKRIFEGDIVHCVARLDEANCVVIFEDGEFRLVPERNYKTYVTGAGFHALRCFEKEVIGNIHDNPELMEDNDHAK